MDLPKAMKALAKNVKSLRISRGLTQEKMRDLGFNYRYFQKIEAGHVNVTLDTLVRLANTLKCNLPDLLR
ncbi:MAG: helix-turn-helix transcriptional regulator [Deltaproteobacteria bacterium]|nr:helix-turn-helix transcriptional regulator [Deltaproteobacteria bacterium]